MKKLLVLLLISALAVFVFAGCDLLPNGDGDGDGDGDGGVTEVTVEIDGAVEIGGKTYVSGGSHDITVTFPAPVENASASIGICTGDFSKDSGLAELISVPVVLFPVNDDGTVWSGSGNFLPGIDIENLDLDPSFCCASYVYVTSGECEENVCIKFPVIVDWEPPIIGLKATGSSCGSDDICAPFSGCKVKFEVDDEECEEICCGDYCSGVGAWSIEIYKATDVHAGACCDLSLCSEPVDHIAGDGCPIEWTSKCLDSDLTYYVFITVADKVGNKIEGFYEMKFDTDCFVTLKEKECNNGEFTDVSEENKSHLFDGAGCYTPLAG